MQYELELIDASTKPSTESAEQALQASLTGLWEAYHWRCTFPNQQRVLEGLAKQWVSSLKNDYWPMGPAPKRGSPEDKLRHTLAARRPSDGNIVSAGSWTVKDFSHFTRSQVIDTISTQAQLLRSFYAQLGTDYRDDFYIGWYTEFAKKMYDFWTTHGRFVTVQTMGTIPEANRTGAASRIVAEITRIVDEEYDLPIYLESTVMAAPVYERYGFKEVDRMQWGEFDFLFMVRPRKSGV